MLVSMSSHQSCGKKCIGGHQAYRRLDVSRWVLLSVCLLYLTGHVAYGISVIPESAHQDTVGTFARTVRDAVYALDVIYGVDPLDNYTLAQVGKTPNGSYSQYLTNSDTLQNATFGLPWQSFWALASEEHQVSLLGLIERVENAGATVINGTELPNYQTIVSPNGWNWYIWSLPAEKVAHVLTTFVTGIMGPPEDIQMSLNSPM